MREHRAIVAILIAAATLPAAAEGVTGRVFDDRNGNSVWDAGEPMLPGVEVELYGVRDVGGAYDASLSSASDGSFSFSPGSGCYLLLPADPPGWRFCGTRADGFPESTSGYTFPVGQSRFAKLDHGIASLKAGSLLFVAAGDSIAYNWNSCFFPSSFWYSKEVRSRIACTAPTAAVTLDQAAVKGQHTDDLLIDDQADQNNVFRIIESQPQLVTISMIGNDLLNAEPPSNPTQDQINLAVLEILDSRQNLQEALSALVSEIPTADVALNTLYDNLAYNCYSGDTSVFHRQWLPIVDGILRDLAWGQVRRVSINEVAAEFAHEDQQAACTGFDQMICRDIFQTDRIHPNNNGYTVLREKVWEACGGTNLGPKDALGRSSIANDFGFLRRLRRLLPTTSTALGGAVVTDAAAAFDDEDGGASARISLGIGQEEVRLAGFPSWYDEDQIVRAIVGVRYRTTGTVNDDFYRMEASVQGQFRPPAGHAYTPTDWNYYTPIVGGGGPNRPLEDPDFPTAQLLVRPNVLEFREVSAALNKNPVLPTGASDYSWPPVSQLDLPSTSVRVASAPVAGTAGNDAYEVELDAAWIDLYGWQKARPGEVENLRAQRLPDGTVEVSFDPVVGAERYNLYFGRLTSIRQGSYDHGSAAPAPPLCGASTQDAGGGRLVIAVSPPQAPSVDSYFLLTAHVDGVESPSGTRSDGAEIDRSQSVCM